MTTDLVGTGNSNPDVLSAEEVYLVEFEMFTPNMQQLEEEADMAYKQFGYQLEQFKQGCFQKLSFLVHEFDSQVYNMLSRLEDGGKPEEKVLQDSVINDMLRSTLDQVDTLDNQCSSTPLFEGFMEGGEEFYGQVLGLVGPNPGQSDFMYTLTGGSRAELKQHLEMYDKAVGSLKGRMDQMDNVLDDFAQVETDMRARVNQSLSQLMLNHEAALHPQLALAAKTLEGVVSRQLAPSGLACTTAQEDQIRAFVKQIGRAHV